MSRSLVSDMKLLGRAVRELTKISPWFLVVNCLYALFQSGQPFISIYFAARIIDGIIEQRKLKELLILVICLVGLECICTIIMKVMDGFKICEAEKINTGIRVKIAEKLLKIDFEKVEDPQFQRQKEKIENAERTMGMGIAQIAYMLPDILKYGCTILWSAALTFRLFFAAGGAESGWKGWISSPVFSTALIVFIIAGIYVNMKSTVTSRNKEFEMYNGTEKMENVLSYYINNYIGKYQTGKDIRIYHQQAMILDSLKENYQGWKNWYQEWVKVSVHYSNIGSLVSNMISMLIYLFVGLRALAGMFSVGNIVQYVGSINQFVSGFTNFMKELTDIRANNEAVGYYFDYMAVPDADMQRGIAVKGKPTEIEFHDVSFKYPGTEEYVIRNLSIKFCAGQKTAIVGRNGSGKTTLIKLLCRLYQPTEGKITLNGIDIREYKYEDYLKLIGIVFQDFKLFSYTLGENVAASMNVDKEKIKEVLDKAGFGVRYQTMEKGADTYLYKEYDENGIDVSGGEAQKIAIARALYKNAPIVILDEPTAALDPLSEYDIYSRFNEMVEEKMAIFISHRLSSCRFCDKIAVMDMGKLVQLGDHDTLVSEREGKYYELWNAQAQYYEKENTENEKGNEAVSAGVADIYQ